MPTAPSGGYDPRKLKSDESSSTQVQQAMEKLVKKVENLAKQGPPQDEKLKKQFEKAVKEIRKNADKLDKESTGFEKDAAKAQKGKPKDQQKGIDKLMKSVGGINKAGTDLGKISKKLEEILKKGPGKSAGKPNPSAEKNLMRDLTAAVQESTNIAKKLKDTSSSISNNIKG